MNIAVSVATVVKKAAELLLTNKKGIKFVGYVIGIALFIILLPAIMLWGFFGWMSGDGGTLIDRDMVISRLPIEQQEQIASIDTVCDTIVTVFKTYAFLPPEIKMLVNEITDELAKDARIKRLYDLWYESKYAVLKMYTEHLPPQKPLSQEETFKPIRNAIIKGACEIGFTNTHQASFVSVTKLLNSASKIIESKINDNLSLHPEIAVDSKLRREIEAKKKGQNISM